MDDLSDKTSNQVPFLTPNLKKSQWGNGKCLKTIQKTDNFYVW